MDTLALAVLVSHALAAPTPHEVRPAIPAAATVTVGPVIVRRFAPPARLVSTFAATQDSMFEYSAAYYRRLGIHRAASYAMLPLFAFQVAAGMQLYDKSFEAPAWARTGHRIAATGVAALFVVNTATGIPNILEARRDPDGRRRKIFHALMMLSADAGFVATGILADRAETSPDDRDLHRAVALTSMGIATVGYLSMLDIFRRD